MTPAILARWFYRLTSRRIVIGGEGRVTAYASVIDMQTNDPTYVPGDSGVVGVVETEAGQERSELAELVRGERDFGHGGELGVRWDPYAEGRRLSILVDGESERRQVAQHLPIETLLPPLFGGGEGAECG
jgi:hypothetical protein